MQKDIADIMKQEAAEKEVIVQNRILRFTKPLPFPSNESTN